MPTMANASATLPPASATGSTTWLRLVTSIEAGSSTTAAQAAIAIDSSPPSGKPTSTLRRDVARSFSVQRSSIAPEEKKNTSYGVMAAPKSATAKNQYVATGSPWGGPGWSACPASTPQ